MKGGEAISFITQLEVAGCSGQAGTHPNWAYRGVALLGGPALLWRV